MVVLPIIPPHIQGRKGVHREQKWWLEKEYRCSVICITILENVFGVHRTSRAELTRYR